MKLKIDDNAVYKTSSGTVIKNLGDDRFVAWNRYAPSAFLINGDTVKLLDFMKTNDQPYTLFKGVKRTLRKLIAANLLYEGKHDPFKKHFFDSGGQFMDTHALRLKKQARQKSPYIGLNLYNNTCNLKCSYCIMEYATAHKPKNPPTSKPSKAEKKKRLTAVIDQVLKDSHLTVEPTEQWKPEKTAKKTKLGKRQLQVQFNGGEFLLEWELMKYTVEYLEKNYPHVETKLNVNTNGTLVTDEIAAFLHEKNFKTIGISIDGYEESHNQSRVYHNGKGSYKDVIRGIETINRYRDEPLRFFQGTIVPEHQINIDRVMEMQKLDFQRARLGVNLLGISTEEAHKMAKLHFDMAMRSIKEGLGVADDYFRTYATIPGEKEENQNFTFFCRGFSDLAGQILYYNVETRQVNFLCHYLTEGHVNLEDVENDIHHPSISENAEKYLRQRYEIINTFCADCEVVGVCRGGCILSGIDAYNKPNESACTFVKDTWTYYLDYTFKQKEIASVNA
ncbi:MAG: radical SAM protein [bacterium]|nr:radical SAM protein [bacterium]